MLSAQFLHAGGVPTTNPPQLRLSRAIPLLAKVGLAEILSYVHLLISVDGYTDTFHVIAAVQDIFTVAWTVHPPIHCQRCQLLQLIVVLADNYSVSRLVPAVDR